MKDRNNYFLIYKARLLKSSIFNVIKWFAISAVFSVFVIFLAYILHLICDANLEGGGLIC